MSKADSPRGMKRRLEDDRSDGNSRDLPCCTYGIKCYRRNALHFREFSHPHLDELLAKKIPRDTTLPPNMYVQHVSEQLDILQEERKKMSETAGSSLQSSSSIPSGSRSSSEHKNITHSAHSHKADSIASKIEAAAPYFLFLARAQSSERTHNEPLSITFHELLDNSLGQLHSSMLMNFMVEMDWLDAQYNRHSVQDKPLLIVYDELTRGSKPMRPNITVQKVHTPSPFGHHHSKLSFYYYMDQSVRVVVHTANFIESDWENRTQGVWVSPACPCLPQPDSKETDGESPTQFKDSLLRYLLSFDFRSQVDFKEWIQRIRMADFSKINVFFIASIPKTHRYAESDRWGHKRLRNILKANAIVPSSTWPVIAQCSSIGSLGPKHDSWVCSELLESFSQHSNASDKSLPTFKLIYPSLANVRNSCDGIAGGGCLPYSKLTHLKQQWLNDYLYEWQCDTRHRTAIMPHIKTYARVSPCDTKMAWFHMSSANLSKAAWGSINKDKTGLYLLSYEVGVLFLPKFVLSHSATEFNLKGENAFPLPYDLPLVKYASNDIPWFYNVLQEAFARHQRE